MCNLVDRLSYACRFPSLSISCFNSPDPCAFSSPNSMHIILASYTLLLHCSVLSVTLFLRWAVCVTTWLCVQAHYAALRATSAAAGAERAGSSSGGNGQEELYSVDPTTGVLAVWGQAAMQACGKSEGTIASRESRLHVYIKTSVGHSHFFVFVSVTIISLKTLGQVWDFQGKPVRSQRKRKRTDCEAGVGTACRAH